MTIAATVAKLCHWMTWYSMTQTVLISLGCLMLAILLAYIGVRLIKVMVLCENDDDEDD